MNRKKTLRFYLALAAGSAALLAGCSLAPEFVLPEQENEGGILGNPPANVFDPSVPSFYVSGAGSDKDNEGKDSASPLATLAAAYEKALADKTRKRIVVLSDLIETGLVTLSPANKTVAGSGFILIEGRRAGLKIERSTGANDSVLQIQDGAKVVFKNITVNGKIAPHDNGAKANNRAILVTGKGTEVVLRNRAVATGKTYLGSADIDSNNHGSGIRVIKEGKLVMETGSAVTGCEGVGHVNGAIQLNNGILEMKAGSRVYGNIARHGGGVQVYNSSVFTMYGGEISGNSAAKSGGGVHLQYNAVFTMHGGAISGNEAANFGGGIATGSQCAFTMKGGKITGNRSVSGGGGIEVFKTAFTMEGGEIGGNTTEGNGGGVYLSDNAESTFKMIGGVVYGSDVPVSLANTVDVSTSKTGAALYKSAKAVIEVPGYSDTTETTIDMR